MNKWGTYALGALVFSAVSGAQSAEITLDPEAQIASIGEVVAFDLLADFGATATTGGAIDITWDAAILGFNDFTYDPDFGAPPRDTVFDVEDLQSPGLLSIGFGNVGGITISDATTIGSITFEILADGETSIVLADSEKWGGFFDLTGAAITVSYNDVTVATPIPAAAWLFISGLCVLGFLGNRRDRVSA